MKKFLMLILLSFAGLQADNDSPSFLDSQEGVFLSGVAAVAAATWLLGETLRDMGHRYAHCCQEAAQYQEELDAEFPELLNDKEKAFWATVQGWSYVPKYWWRELTAAAITTALYVYGLKAITGNEAILSPSYHFQSAMRSFRRTNNQ